MEGHLSCSATHIGLSLEWQSPGWVPFQGFESHLPAVLHHQLCFSVRVCSLSLVSPQIPYNLAWNRKEPVTVCDHKEAIERLCTS